MMSALYQTNSMLSWIFIVLGHAVCGRHVAPIKHIILMLYYIVFSFTLPGLEITIYQVQDEHANHCITDAFYLENEENHYELLV
jgi:hypothetical protein